MSVRIETNVGDFIVNLFTEDAPKASFNFLKLCKLNYYAYSIFLRCEPNFLLQGGDPTNTGKGGKSIWGLLNDLIENNNNNNNNDNDNDNENSKNRFFEDEINLKKRKHLMRGTLSMASAGKDKNASQFFFTLADELDFLDGTCTIFGQLTEFKRRARGDEIENVTTFSSVDTEKFFEYFNEEVFCDENNRPFQDIFIIRTEVICDPFPDPENFKALMSSSILEDKETCSFLKFKRIGAHESLDDFKWKSEEEIENELRERAAASNALVLEIIGDLPSADVKPPENVLFICKLNSITRSEDLKMIFSRFGRINSCEIIKDRETNSSLGYGFIEFDQKESCEQAYLKMNGVLIDDRRIKVDFSQSVSKLHKQWENSRKSKNSNNNKNPNVEVTNDRYRYRGGDPYHHNRREGYTSYSRDDRRDYRHRSRSRSKSPRRDNYYKK